MKDEYKQYWTLNLTSRLAGLPGDIVEAGVAEGGAALSVLFFLGCTGDLAGRVVHMFDTWEGLPPSKHIQDTEFSVGAYKKSYKAFETNVEIYGEAWKIHMQGHPWSWQDVWSHAALHRGLFADTMPGAMQGRQVAFLMCDGDMYGSSMDCLRSAEPHVVAGGWVYMDDYYRFLGSFLAVQDYLRANGGRVGAPGLRLVAQEGPPVLLREDTECEPPRNNRAFNLNFGRLSGRCNGTRVEACFWQKRAQVPDAQRLSGGRLPRRWKRH